MANFTFTADGTFDVSVSGPTWIHVRNGASFGGGSIAALFETETGAYDALQNSSGTAVAYTAGADDFYDFPKQCKVRLSMTGSTNPNVYVQIQSEPRR